MGFLATVLLLTFSTNTYPLPAKKQTSHFTVKNEFNASDLGIFLNHVYHTLDSKVSFTVAPETTPYTPHVSCFNIEPGNQCRKSIEHEDTNFIVEIHYHIWDRSHHKRTAGSIRRNVRSGAHIRILNDGRRVYLITAP